MTIEAQTPHFTKEEANNSETLNKMPKVTPSMHDSHDKNHDSCPDSELFPYPTLITLVISIFFRKFYSTLSFNSFISNLMPVSSYIYLFRIHLEVWIHLLILMWTICHYYIFIFLTFISIISHVFYQMKITISFTIYELNYEGTRLY